MLKHKMVDLSGQFEPFFGEYCIIDVIGGNKHYLTSFVPSEQGRNKRRRGFALEEFTWQS